MVLGPPTVRVLDAVQVTVLGRVLDAAIVPGTPALVEPLQALQAASLSRGAGAVLGPRAAVDVG